MSVAAVEGQGDLRGVVGSHWSMYEKKAPVGDDIESGFVGSLDVRGKTRWSIYVSNPNAFPVQLYIAHRIGVAAAWYEGPIPCAALTDTIVDRGRSCDFIDFSLVSQEEEPDFRRLAAHATTGGG